MRVRIVKIGNSRGIRIPKPLLDQTGIINDVEVIMLEKAFLQTLVKKEQLKERLYVQESADEMKQQLREIRANGSTHEAGGSPSPSGSSPKRQPR